MMAPTRSRCRLRCARFSPKRPTANTAQRYRSPSSAVSATSTRAGGCAERIPIALLRDAADKRPRLVDYRPRQAVDRFDQRSHLRARHRLDDKLRLLRITQQFPVGPELGEGLP